MAIQLPRDLSEYYLMEYAIDVTTTATTVAIFPCPRSGYLDRVYATLQSGAHAGSDTTLTFEIGGVAVSNASLVIPTTASAAGRTHMVNIAKGQSDAYVLEAEDQDLIADGSCIEVVTDAAGTAGTTVNILAVIKRA